MRWQRATPAQRGAAVAALVLALAAGAWWATVPAEAPTGGTGLRPGSDGALVRSHEGTVPDGDLRLWAQGQTLSGLGQGLPYAELRRMFDYFLSGLGEQGLPAIVTRIGQEIQAQLPSSQQAAAQALLRKYLDYKQALVALDRAPGTQGTGVDAIRARFDGMLALRARFFTPQEDAAMFGFDDAYDRDAIARLEIHQNSALSAAQKRERLAVLDAALPAAVKAERDAPRQIIHLESQVAALRTQGATDAQVFALRAQALGPEAAERLAVVDREEREWQQRIAAYQQARQALLQQQTNSSAGERATALAQLQQARFSAAEIPRLVAYEN